LEIKTINKEEKFQKEILYKNGRIKHFLYYKCREIIICRDLTVKDSPTVSMYPPMSFLVNKFKKLEKKKMELTFIGPIRSINREIHFLL